MSLRALAAEVGISASYLHDIETDRRRPSPKVLAELCGLLGLADSDIWPLPEGWSWGTAPAGYPVAWRADGFGGVCCFDGKVCFVKGPKGYSLDAEFAVIDILRARWEAGQA